MALAPAALPMLTALEVLSLAHNQLLGAGVAEGDGEGGWAGLQALTGMTSLRELSLAGEPSHRTTWPSPDLACTALLTLAGGGQLLTHPGITAGASLPACSCRPASKLHTQPGLAHARAGCGLERLPPGLLDLPQLQVCTGARTHLAGWQGALAAVTPADSCSNHAAGP